MLPIRRSQPYRWLASATKADQGVPGTAYNPDVRAQYSALANGCIQENTVAGIGYLRILGAQRQQGFGPATAAGGPRSQYQYRELPIV